MPTHVIHNNRRLAGRARTYNAMISAIPVEITMPSINSIVRGVESALTNRSVDQVMLRTEPIVLRGVTFRASNQHSTLDTSDMYVEYTNGVWSVTPTSTRDHHVSTSIQAILNEQNQIPNLTTSRVRDTNVSVSVTESQRTMVDIDVEPLGWADDYSAFSAVYNEVKASDAEHPEYRAEGLVGEFHKVGFLTELGRSFGLEIEIDFPQSRNYGTERSALARKMYEANLSTSPDVHSWHYAARRDNMNGTPGYSSDRNTWTVEFDRSVDDVGGARGCEIVSPILYNTPETWADVKTIIDFVKELGGEVNVRHGLHVNLGSRDFAGNDVFHMSLVRALRRYDDLLIRIAHTPENGAWHRGRSYCTTASEGYANGNVGRYMIQELMGYNGHHSIVNFTHSADTVTRAGASTRLEFRLFDGTLDVGRIQMNVMLSMAMMAAAARATEAPFEGESEAGGTHFDSRPGRARRLSGAEWRTDTERVREFVDFLGLPAEGAKDVLIAYKASRWQRA
jgi:Putative amidoligase enzyme